MEQFDHRSTLKKALSLAAAFKQQCDQVKMTGNDSAYAKTQLNIAKGGIEQCIDIIENTYQSDFLSRKNPKFLERFYG